MDHCQTKPEAAKPPKPRGPSLAQLLYRAACSGPGRSSHGAIFGSFTPPPFYSYKSPQEWGRREASSPSRCRPRRTVRHFSQIHLSPTSALYPGQYLRPGSCGREGHGHKGSQGTRAPGSPQRPARRRVLLRVEAPRGNRAPLAHVRPQRAGVWGGLWPGKQPVCSQALRVMI